jgi:hypothetical protein
MTEKLSRPEITAKARAARSRNALRRRLDRYAEELRANGWTVEPPAEDHQETTEAVRP